MSGTAGGWGLDRYERGARLYPAILTVAPILISLVLWLPASKSLLAAGGGTLLSAGLVALLVNFARFRGRAVQQQLVARWGGLPTLLAIRHDGALIDQSTRLRYHSALRSRGQEVPTVAEQARDPEKADSLFATALSWLISNTQDRRVYARLKDENIAFGFRRNLLGLKPVGLVLSLLTAVGSLAAWLIVPDHKETSLLTGIAGIAASLLWTLVIRPSFVRDAGDAYATELLRICDHGLPAKPRSKGQSKSTAAASEK